MRNCMTFLPLLLSIILCLPGIPILIRQLRRNRKTRDFMLAVLDMVCKASDRCIMEARFDDVEKLWRIMDKHQYDEILYSFRPLTLEAWYTEEEIALLRKGDDNIKKENHE